MLIGNLTQDPDVRQTLSGKKISILSLAINRTEKDENGEKKQKTTFLYCKCYAKLADLAERYLSKGKAVFVEGRLEMVLWQDKQTGQQRSRVDVVADNLQFLSSWGDRQKPQPPPYGEEEEDISF